MQKYWNTVQDERGSPRQSVSVAVQQSGSNSTIYSDQAGSLPKTNPLTTDTRGYFEFYAAAGEYDLVVSGTGFSTYTITDGALIGLPSADVTFTQSGSGAVAEDVQTALRRFIFASQYSTFANALTAAANKRLVIDSEITISANVTVPRTVELVVVKGGSFAVATGVTLSLAGPLVAGPYQIFSGAGTATFSTAELPRVSPLQAYAEWWGAARDGSTDDGPPFQKAINAVAAAFGGCVQLLYGTYAIATALTIPYGMTIRGVNMLYSTLKWTGGASVMITTDIPANVTDLMFEDFGLDQTGTGTVAILIKGTHYTLTRIYASPVTKWSTAIVQTNTVNACPHGLYEDIVFSSSAAGQETPVFIDLGDSNSTTFKNIFLSGFSTAGVRLGNTGNPLGVTFIGGRIESFSGSSAPYPGSATAIGVQVVAGSGISLHGVDFEMDGDVQASAAAQRCVSITACDGFSLVGGRLKGNGHLTAAVTISGANAKGVYIGGGVEANGINGYAVAVTNNSATYEVGLIRCSGITTGPINDSQTPTLTGITDAGGGSETYTLRFRRTGDMVSGSITCAPSGGHTIASTYLTTYATTGALPTPLIRGECRAWDLNAGTLLGTGYVNTDGRIYFPTFAANGNTIDVHFTYRAAAA